MRPLDGEAADYVSYVSHTSGHPHDSWNASLEKTRESKGNKKLKPYLHNVKVDPLKSETKFLNYGSSIENGTVDGRMNGFENDESWDCSPPVSKKTVNETNRKTCPFPCGFSKKFILYKKNQVNRYDENNSIHYEFEPTTTVVDTAVSLENKESSDNATKEIYGSSSELNSVIQRGISHLSVWNTELHHIIPSNFLFVSLHALTSLKMLNLSNSNLETLPEAIGELKVLRELNLNSNWLSNLPESCMKLGRLRTLILSRNRFSEPPTCLEKGLGMLTLLDLSHNQLTKYEIAPMCAAYLQTLRLDRNELSYVPTWILSDWRCRAMELLDLSHNTCFQYEFHVATIQRMDLRKVIPLDTLTVLRASNCMMRPSSAVFVSMFKKLKSVDFGNYSYDESNCSNPNMTSNNLYELEGFFSNPGSLMELRVPNVGLAFLPESIPSLTSLRLLDISHNQLYWLPFDSFCLLTALETCIISFNKLTALPADIGKMQALKVLRLNSNNLTSLPESLANLANLEVLDLYDNSIYSGCDVLLTLPKLRALDFAYNHVDLPLSTTASGQMDLLAKRYARLVQELRSSQPDCSVRVNERRPEECFTDNEGQDHIHSVSSESPRELSDYEEDTSDLGNVQYSNNDSGSDWDEAVCPDDLYDPTVDEGEVVVKLLPTAMRQSKLLQVSRYNFGVEQPYTPADYHAEPLPRRRFTRSPTAPVDGQFDDP